MLDCILRNLNDKSSLIIYDCPIKQTMKFHFKTRHVCKNIFKTCGLIHVDLTNKEYTQCMHSLRSPPLPPSPTKRSTISTFTNGYLNYIRLLTKMLLFRFRIMFSEASISIKILQIS